MACVTWRPRLIDKAMEPGQTPLVKTEITLREIGDAKGNYPNKESGLSA